MHEEYFTTIGISTGTFIIKVHFVDYTTENRLLSSKAAGKNCENINLSENVKFIVKFKLNIF